jgi:hypothetical protein
MSALELTAVTDFILAGEAFLAAGFLFGRIPAGPSAAFFWTLAVLFFALGALAGGIDHGFFEPKGDTRGRMIVQKTTWIFTGAMTFFTMMTALFQFAPAGLHAPAVILGLLQFAAFCFFATRKNSYLVVILNYAPVLLVLLVLNVAGLPSGTGSWWMVAGILISIAASAVQALGVDAFSPLDRNGLYHVILMIAVVFLFLGGLGFAG